MQVRVRSSPKTRQVKPRPFLRSDPADACLSAGFSAGLGECDVGCVDCVGLGHLLENPMTVEEESSFPGRTETEMFPCPAHRSALIGSAAAFPDCRKLYQ